MVIGSHNSWSYLPPQQWWLRPFHFMARCQSKDITTQYLNHGVRCFDLRLTFDKDGTPHIAHGFMRYRYTQHQLLRDLSNINLYGNCYVRVLHEVRHKYQYTERSRHLFADFCKYLVELYPDIHFWCGRNLYDWSVDYSFPLPEPSCHEVYSSVAAPRIIDDWFPYLFAKRKNKDIFREGTDKDILLVDFVNIS